MVVAIAGESLTLLLGDGAKYTLGPKVHSWTAVRSYLYATIALLALKITLCCASLLLHRQELRRAYKSDAWRNRQFSQDLHKNWIT